MPLTNLAHQCADCNQQAPQTDDSFTLISARFGWRLEIERDEAGKRTPVWRCPDCWKRYRSQRKTGEAGNR